ncbi:MAG: glycosyltransferase family 4 protein [Bacteroidetes bacterium]|nr:glycosyltransferase family 4 protein [Bacteroidota bacterium]
MKILLLSDINSAHTVKWTNELVNNSIDIAVFSLSAPNENALSEINTKKIFIPSYLKNKTAKQSIFAKLAYLKALPDLLNAIEEFNPDIVHAHYASSYGLLGRNCKFKPFVISAWGSDVLDFPKKSFFHKNILKKNLQSATVVTATSKIMVEKIREIASIEAIHIPFGIDLSQFFQKKVQSIFKSEDNFSEQNKNIVFGCVKSLETIYGQSFLIKAFAQLASEFSELSLKLLLVGDGSLMNKYKLSVNELGINNKVVFAGKAPYSEICNYHNMIDVFVNYSLNESFGVSVLEASACEKPVIASNIGGLPEVVNDGITGMLVPPANVELLFQTMKDLLLNKQKAINMGKQGRQWVKQNFDFEKNVNSMIEIYNQIL